MLDRRRACAWLIAASFALAACSTSPPAASTEQGGGPYLVLELDTTRLREQMLEGVADTMSTELREAAPPIRYEERSVANDTARVRLSNHADLQRALPIVRGIANHPDTHEEMLTVSVAGNDTVEARFTPSYLRSLAQRTVEQSIEVVRRRVDPRETGAFEVVQQAETQIVVRAPRGTDPSQLRQSVGIRGVLSFHLVRDVSPEDVAAGRLPPGTMLAQPYPNIGNESEVVERRARFTGERLVRAHPSTDRLTRESVISFGLDTEGTLVFCRVTRENVGKRFAVLLDNQVITAPRINEAICGGAGQLSGAFTPQTASDVAAILRAGALPSPLIVVEEGVAPARR